MHNSLSVNINVDANLHRSQSAIKLTFSSTINGHAAQPVSQQSQQMTPMSDFCKSELDATPVQSTDPAAVGDPQTSDFPAGGDSIDNEYLDELYDLLDKLDEDTRCSDAAAETNVGAAASEQTAGPPSGRDVVGATGRYSSALPLYPPAYCGTTAFSSPASTDTSAAASPACVGLMGNTASAPTLLGDSGPAAETLKQMAAQHQSLHENSVGRHYAYPDGHLPAGAFRGPSAPARMPRYRAVLATGGGGYMMPTGPSAMCHMDPRAAAAAAASYGPVYPETAQYRAPPPSSSARFVTVPQHGHGVTSSLQRLESQVRSQFAPMPATASALSTDAQAAQQQQHFRLEQSQRVDVRAPGQVVVAARQQQSFVMSMDSPQQQQPHQQPSQRPYPSSANTAAYSQYPGPVRYRMTAGPFVAASGTVPGSYGGMPAVMAQQQQAVGVPPPYAAVQSHDQDNASIAGRPPTSARLPSGRASSSSHGPPQSTSMGLQLPTKVEAGVGYAVGDVASDCGVLKGAADAPSSANYSVLSHGKLTHPQQRPPNVTVVPGPTGAINFHPHAGVKWLPSGVARHPYAGGYPVDGASAARQSDSHGPGGGGWSLSMSQTQSLYMSNSAGEVPCHMSGPAAAGYPPAGTAGPVQRSADPSRMQRIPNAVGADVVFQRNAAAPGQVYMDVYPGAYNSRDFAFTDNVFVSK